jgi:hypothetical protein
MAMAEHPMEATQLSHIAFQDKCFAFCDDDRYRRFQGARFQMSDEKILEIILDYFNAQEAACVNAKRQISELVNATESHQTVSEQTFNVLKFVEHKGEKLNEFGTAERKDNDEQAWLHAFNILKQNDSTINKRFHGVGYVYSYWIYNERIFRQKLKG